MGEIKLNDKEKSYVLILKDYFKLYNYWKKECTMEIDRKEIDNKTLRDNLNDIDLLLNLPNISKEDYKYLQVALIDKGDNSNSSIAFRNNYSNSGLSNRVNSTCLKIINAINHI